MSRLLLSALIGAATLTGCYGTSGYALDDYGGYPDVTLGIGVTSAPYYGGYYRGDPYYGGYYSRPYYRGYVPYRAPYYGRYYRSAPYVRGAPSYRGHHGYYRGGSQYRAHQGQYHRGGADRGYRGTYHRRR